MRSQCSCETPAFTFYIKSFVLFFSFFTTIPVNAFEFEHGELYGSWDTTVSYGQTHRVQSRSANLLAIVNGTASSGTDFSSNGDDGNLNYDSGLVSSTLKFTTEMELNYRNFGAFVRGTGFRDIENDSAFATERTNLTKETIELVGRDIKLLDAYVWGGFDLGKMPLDIRVGEQVISWGESTFIQNGINVINPFDVSKIRLPGSELKEALLPVGIVSAALGLNENVSMEAFYQYDYERVLIDPVGSYFSTTDLVGFGGNCAVLGFGLTLDYPLLPADGSNNRCDLGILDSAPRAPDDRPDEGGQYGVALRAYVEQLNDTEFGFYYLNYHSRVPVLNAFRDPTTAGVPGFASYQVAYPEDIDLFGVSFNTQLGTTGIALQGEYSFKIDAPLQIDDVELLFAALNDGTPNQITGFASTPGPGLIQGFIERDVSQFQVTATKIFGPTFKADQAVLAGEIAVTHVHDMPDKDVLRLNAPGTDLPGPTFLGITADRVILGSDPNDKFADATSWGYRIVGRLEYNNVLGALTLRPRFGWRHDVGGITPGPGGNFVEGQKVISVGVSATYQNSWVADIGYTSYLGDDDQHLLHDRDFIAFSLSYSF